MSYTTVIAAIKTLLDAVSGIGNTFDYIRLETDITEQKNRFTTAGGIFHSWFITRTSVSATPSLNKQLFRDHQFDIVGFYAVDDDNASEKTFQLLCENIQNKFDNVGSTELISGVQMIEPSEILEINHVIWCDVLCHRAIIRINVQEELSVA